MFFCKLTNSSEQLAKIMSTVVFGSSRGALICSLGDGYTMAEIICSITG